MLPQILPLLSGLLPHVKRHCKVIRVVQGLLSGKPFLFSLSVTTRAGPRRGKGRGSTRRRARDRGGRRSRRSLPQRRRRVGATTPPAAGKEGEWGGGVGSGGGDRVWERKQGGREDEEGRRIGGDRRSHCCPEGGPTKLLWLCSGIVAALPD
ncbi:uncharacterized protein LOC109704286 [Ananas comosus]|uniref:Uncharacterized protein LOC109704286 n=1 Tax=Ananas comosus TaxID=4615 RepID=A0A6P5EBE0_ANACO|nr:uncharacterized protein LOC109704286 [Ananas comosus]